MSNCFMYLKGKNDDCWEKLGKIDHTKYNLPMPLQADEENKMIIREKWKCDDLDKLILEIIECVGSDVLLAAGSVDKKSKICVYSLFLGEVKNGEPIIYTGEHKVGKKKYANIYEWIKKDVFRLSIEATKILETLLEKFGIFDGWDMRYDYFKLFTSAKDLEAFPIEDKKFVFSYSEYESVHEKWVEKKGGKVQGKTVNGKTDMLVIGADIGVNTSAKLRDACIQSSAKSGRTSKLIVMSENEFTLWKTMLDNPKSLETGTITLDTYVRSEKKDAKLSPTKKKKGNDNTEQCFMYLKGKNDQCWEKLGKIDSSKYNLPISIQAEEGNKYIIREEWECDALDELISEIIECVGSDVVLVVGSVNKKDKICAYSLFLGEFNNAGPIIYTGRHEVGRRRYANIYEWIKKEVFKMDKETIEILESFGIFDGWDMRYDHFKYFISAKDLEDFSIEGKNFIFSHAKYGSAHKKWVEKKGGKAKERYVNEMTDMLVIGTDNDVNTSVELRDACLQNSPKLERPSKIVIMTEREFILWKKIQNRPKALKTNKLTFGAYIQSAKKDAKPEPIEWNVIIDQKSKQLLISKYIIDLQPFNHRDSCNLEWHESYIREWLNGEFFQTAFSKEEQKRIIKTKLNNRRTTQGCYDIEDYVFLLKDADAKRYFIAAEERQAFGTEAVLAKDAALAKEYAGLEQGYMNFFEYPDKSSGCWRLRTFGGPDPCNYDVPNYIDVFGDKDNEYEADMPMGIRPVIWVKK